VSWFYRTLIRPALFAFDSEEIHDRTLHALGSASRSDVLCEMLETFCSAPRLPMELFGLKFPNPVGLAAGMDKFATAVPAWASLGFGFSELGGVTWHPQPGHPRPRLFRVVSEHALINRMGFNNPGAEAFAQRLAEWRARGRWPSHPVGINLGKSKGTPLEQAAEDYANSFRVLWPYADFFVVNVSSPNTPGLRQLQDKAALDEILAALNEVQRALTKQGDQATSSLHSATRAPQSAIHKPILVKVAPDLSFEALDEILELVGPRQVAGLIATNTTKERPATSDPGLQRIYAETGGLSGRPLRVRSTEIIRHLYRQSQGTVPIIGVGGIFNADDAWEKIMAGASLIQVYTGLVYEGPTLARDIVQGLIERLQANGFQELSHAVGTIDSAISKAKGWQAVLAS
jgi:dihydroorotate dehydrogenase